MEGSEGLKKVLELELKRKKRFLWDFGDTLAPYTPLPLIPQDWKLG